MSTMNDLISRAALLEAFKEEFGCNADCRECFVHGPDCHEGRLILNAPAVNAEPVKYEHWILRQRGKNPGNYTCFCSGCKTEGSLAWKRCPVCEAKMTKEVQE